MPPFVRPDPATLRRDLTPLQYEVALRDATEPPFQNEFWDHHAEGVYVCVVSGQPLFSSRDKFDSGTGWPSFVRPITPTAVRLREDGTHGMARVEVRSTAADTHLGHVFPDGPKPTGMRYCINSASLRFVPRAALVERGYAELAAEFGDPAPAIVGGADNACTVPAGGPPGCAATLETVILAGGCFWGMEEILRQVPGVISSEVGYTGGRTSNPDYRSVRSGLTGHAEAVRLVIDPTVLTFERMLEQYFFLMHDPTTRNRQGNDMGTQYRSAIFFTSDAQRRTAELVKERVGRSGQWPAPVVTEIVAAGPFTRAEDYHQRYLEGNPGGYNCHYVRRKKPGPTGGAPPAGPSSAG